MNNTFDSNEKMSAFLPLTLISLTIVILFVFQLLEMSTARTNLSNLNANAAQVLSQVEPRAQMAKGLWNKLAQDLVEASRDKQDAQQVILAVFQASGIQVQVQPPAGAPAPATP